MRPQIRIYRKLTMNLAKGLACATVALSCGIALAGQDQNVQIGVSSVSSGSGDGTQNMVFTAIVCTKGNRPSSLKYDSSLRKFEDDNQVLIDPQNLAKYGCHLADNNSAVNLRAVQDAKTSYSSNNVFNAQVGPNEELILVWLDGNSLEHGLAGLLNTGGMIPSMDHWSNTAGLNVVSAQAISSDQLKSGTVQLVGESGYASETASLQISTTPAK